MSRLQKALFLSDKGYADLKKAIFACTLTNLAMLLPFCVTVMIFSEILTPFVNGGSIQWNHIWMLWGAGIVSAILVFLAAKNDYRKTYIASYKESNTTRLRIAEHLRKLPMNFFKFKDRNPLIHYRIDAFQHFLTAIRPVKRNIRIFSFTGHPKTKRCSKTHNLMRTHSF